MAFRIPFLIGLIAFGAAGQILHPTGDRPSFEVATIKPWKRPPAPSAAPAEAPVRPMKVAPVGGSVAPLSDRVNTILPITLLVAAAYNLPVGSESRILGLPDWMKQDADQYEIQAKIEDSEFAAMQKMTPAQQREQVALMEQSLLADRFKLKVHFESREMPVYTLVIAKGGSKLTPARDGESSRLSMTGNAQGGEMTAIAVTLDQFVLSPFLTGSAGGRPVMDQTGLKGAYDFTLRWQPDQIAADSPFFFNAIQEQLGLRLLPSKTQVEVIVIDHIERPSPN